MNVNTADIAALSDDELWERARELANRERGGTADLVEHLAEIDDRRLSFRRGHGALFDYCVCFLRLSEAAAYRRIRAARAIRIFPPLSALLRDGRLSLESVVMLHPHLKDPDAATLVSRACGLRIRELEKLLAQRQKPGPQRDSIHWIGDRAADPSEQPQTAASALTAGKEEAPVNASTQQPATLVRSIRFAFTADEDFLRMLEKARSLLRHKYPNGRLEGVLGDALKALLERKDPDVRRRRLRSRYPHDPHASYRQQQPA